MEPLSPELALVDPRLAAPARAALPTNDVFAVLDALRAAEPPSRRGVAGPALAAGLAVALALAVFAPANDDELPKRVQAAPELATPAAAHTDVHHHRAPARSVGRAVSHPPTVRRPQVAPKPKPSRPRAAPKRATSPSPARTRLLTWRPQPRATYYRVQVFADRLGAEPVLRFEVWTAQPRLRVARPLDAGPYRWVVFPVFGQRGRIGGGTSPAKPIAGGSFAVSQ